MKAVKIFMQKILNYKFSIRKFYLIILIVLIIIAIMQL